jgi:hypothetical protein
MKFGIFYELQCRERHTVSSAQFQRRLFHRRSSATRNSVPDDLYLACS